MNNKSSDFSPNLIIFQTFRFLKIFLIFLNFTSMHRWNHLKKRGGGIHIIAGVSIIFIFLVLLEIGSF